MQDNIWWIIYGRQRTPGEIWNMMDDIWQMIGDADDDDNETGHDNNYDDDNDDNDDAAADDDWQTKAKDNSVNDDESDYMFGWW